MTASDGLTKALQCATAALDKKAIDLVVLDVRGLTSIADYLLICTGRSDRQVQAIGQAVDAELRTQGHRPIAVEGMTRGQWVLMDFNDVIVHVFQKPIREFYDLERLWEHAPEVPLPEPLRSQALGFSSETAAV
ncbi:MAG: ribosome silencing factor [Deltaproteobacteria bacterium]|nr:ribosome silencing factor [Deltaproteobacteria bacterium]